MYISAGNPTYINAKSIGAATIVDLGLDARKFHLSQVSAATTTNQEGKSTNSSASAMASDDEQTDEDNAEVAKADKPTESTIIESGSKEGDVRSALAGQFL